MPFNPREQILAAPPNITAVPSIKEENPTPPRDVNAELRTPPVIGEGVKLARLVLYIAAGSIVLLLGYLLSMDLVIGSDIQRSYDHILNPSRIGSEFYTLGRLETFSLDLIRAKDPSVKASQQSVDNAQSILNTIDALPSVTTTQRDKLKACLPLLQQTGAATNKVDECVAALDSIRQAALEAAAGATNAQVAAESVTKADAHRQSLHTFWIQAAQLILLNLLLPLLTALLGYIFGTQQVHRTG